MVLATTPQYSTQLYDYVISNNDNNVQILGLVVDTVPFASQRNGMSALMMPELLKIQDPIAQDQNEQSGSSKGRINWTQSNSFVSLEVGRNTNVILPTANTIFESGTESTLIYNFSEKNVNDMMARVLLSSVRVSLPQSCQFNSESVNWSPLFIIGKADLEISSAKSNMIKTIDGHPAAQFLENAEELQSGTPETQRQRRVFAFIQSPLDNSTKRFEVVAGGGGTWSPRSSMLVLEPQANLKPGDKITFYLYDPSINDNDAKLQANAANASKVEQTKIVIESSPVLESSLQAPAISYASDTLLTTVFGLGCETGFLLNDTKYSVDNESITIL